MVDKYDDCIKKSNVANKNDILKFLEKLRDDGDQISKKDFMFSK